MIFPALFKQEFADDATREQNIAIAKEQLEDLELRYNQKDIDIENYQSTKEELERSLFNDLKESDHETLAKSKEGSNKKPAKFIDTWLVVLLVPLIAIPVYLNLGNLNFTKQLDSKKVSSETTNSTMPLKPDGTPDIEKVTERLQQEMEKNPTDPKGWYMLGRAYMLTQSYPEAIESFDKSLSLRPDLAETMLSLADAFAVVCDLHDPAGSGAFQGQGHFGGVSVAFDVGKGFLGDAVQRDAGVFVQAAPKDDGFKIDRDAGACAEIINQGLKGRREAEVINTFDSELVRM